MKPKNRQNYSEQFKRDALDLLQSSNKGLTQVARELGISTSSLRNWKKAALRNTPMLPMSKEEKSTLSAEDLYAQNEQLRKENEYLRRQRDILKKAASILAEDPQLGSR